MQEEEECGELVTRLGSATCRYEKFVLSQVLIATLFNVTHISIDDSRSKKGDN